MAKSIILTDAELSHKLDCYNHSYTAKERLEDAFTDLQGYLIAMRDGHKYRFGPGEAIARLLDLQKKSQKISC